MAEVKLLDRPEDFARFGVNPDRIEPWEDGRRSGSGANDWEWWYSDFIFDDGSAAVAQFFTKAGRKIGKRGDHPAINLRIKLADGTELRDNLEFRACEATYATDGCDVRIRGNYFKGDLRTYHIKAISKKGFGVDVELATTAAPYRPGTAYVQMGDPDSLYTWFCAVPSGTVRGTFIYNGEEHKATGTGYHDHQWGTTNFLKDWNHWIWARQRFDDHTMLIFDLVTSERLGYKRLPICFIQDAQGNLVFESTGDVECKVLSSYEENVASGKTYPKDIDYVFRANGKEAIYHLRQKKVLEFGGIKTSPLAMRLLVKAMGINHSYTRYLGEGELILNSLPEDGEPSELLHLKSDLIYEFMFPGDSFEGHM